jgi:ribokinase
MLIAGLVPRYVRERSFDMIVCLGDLILDVLIRRVGVPAMDSDVARIAVMAGGAAANTATWLAAEGESVGFLGAAGSDFAGDMLIEDLSRRGITCAVIRSADRPSGILLLESGPDGHVRATARRGANDQFELGDEQRALLSRASWLHITAYAFFSESARPAVLEAARLARSSGSSVSLDLGAPHLVSHIGADQYLGLIRATQARVLLANELEASLLAGPAEEALDALARLAPIAVLKRGASGCSVRSGAERFDVEAVAIEEVDATGAGDAFAAGLIHALRSGEDVRGAAFAGCVLGARCASRLGGRPPFAGA